jgi:VCBS repeat-containing protein
VTAAVTPTTIWSPNGKMVPVTVSGIITDTGSGVANGSFAVKDEYGKVQPSGAFTLNADGSYAFSLQLQASRLGSDKNGRLYTVTVTATDKAGLKSAASVAIVAIDHNQ